MGFHNRTIPKGVYGQLSKVREELEEAEDSEEQNQPLMLQIELSDMLGAIRGVCETHNWDFDSLLRFSELRSRVAKGEKSK